MENIADKDIKPLKQAREIKRGGRSPFTAKSVLFAGVLFFGCLASLPMQPDQGSVWYYLKTAAPGIIPLCGSYLAGYFIGWGARRTIKITSIVTGIAVAMVGLLAWVGLDASTIQAWMNSSSAWVGKNVEEAGRHLITFLPSATAAGAGGVLGFRRK